MRKHSELDSQGRKGEDPKQEKTNSIETKYRNESWRGLHRVQENSVISLRLTMIVAALCSLNSGWPGQWILTQNTAEFLLPSCESLLWEPRPEIVIKHCSFCQGLHDVIRLSDLKVQTELEIKVVVDTQTLTIVNLRKEKWPQGSHTLKKKALLRLTCEAGKTSMHQDTCT